MNRRLTKTSVCSVAKTEELDMFSHYLMPEETRLKYPHLPLHPFSRAFVSSSSVFADSLHQVLDRASFSVFPDRGLPGN